MIKKIEEEKKKINEKYEEEMKKINGQHEEEMKKIIELKKEKLKKGDIDIKPGENLEKLKSDKLYNLDEIISLNFTSTDQKINYSLPCVKNDTFAVVEEKLYKEFPEYRENNNYFIQSAQPILRFKTLKENKLKSGFPIILIQENS